MYDFSLRPLNKGKGKEDNEALRLELEKALELKGKGACPSGASATLRTFRAFITGGLDSYKLRDFANYELRFV